MVELRKFIPLNARKATGKWLDDVAAYRSSEFKRKYSKNDIITLGRVACVGREVYQIKMPALPIVNLQKARADLFMDIMEGKCRCPNSRRVEPYLARKGILPMIVEQRHLPWSVQGKDISCLMMDSYAELTDQRFFHIKEGWSFCSHWSDIDHSGNFDNVFRCEGRLDPSRFLPEYRRFFSWFTGQYPGVKVYFINYSAKFDSRQEFRDRVIRIYEAMDGICAEFKDVRCIMIGEEDYQRSENDDYPYHYNRSTYMRFIQNWNQLLGD